MKSKLLLLTSVALMVAGMASAQTRTWVSGTGDDLNPCSRTAPCKTFAGAISKTAAGGMINCLDPGGYGSLTVTKSITIDCTGTLGSILASGVQGVVVNASGINVVLRALDINGAGTTLGTNGVNIFAAAKVDVVRTNISNFSTTGILCNSSVAANLSVVDTEIVQNSSHGINLQANCKAEIQHSYINQNGGAAVLTQASTTDANVAHSYLNANGFGASASNNSQIWLFATQVSHNAQSVNTLTGGVVNSHGNNAILNNTTNILPPNVFTQ